MDFCRECGTMAPEENSCCELVSELQAEIIRQREVIASLREMVRRLTCDDLHTEEVIKMFQLVFGHKTGG